MSTWVELSSLLDWGVVRVGPLGSHRARAVALLCGGVAAGNTHTHTRSDKAWTYKAVPVVVRGDHSSFRRSVVLFVMRSNLLVAFGVEFSLPACEKARRARSSHAGYRRCTKPKTRVVDSGQRCDCNLHEFVRRG